MAGIDVEEDAAGHIKHAIEQAAEEDFVGLVAELHEQFVNLGNDLSGPKPFGSIGPEVSQQQGHHQGAVDTVSDGIADDQTNLVDTQISKIVKVAPDVFGRAVLGSECGPGTAWALAGQQGLLYGTGQG